MTAILPELISAVVGTLLAAAVGFFAWTLRSLVKDVGVIKVDVAVIKSQLTHASADHDKLIETRKDVDNLSNDLNAGFQSIRKRLGENANGKNRDQ